jgi:hypothetical protein
LGAILRILFLVPFGFVVAALAGGFVLAWSGFVIADPDAAPWTVGIAFILSLLVGGIMALPMLAAIIAGELFGLRSFFFWTLLCGAIGAAVGFAPLSFFAYMPFMIEGLGPAEWGATGLVFGAVYWLVAGHLSGVGWRDAGPAAPRNAGGDPR